MLTNEVSLKKKKDSKRGRVELELCRKQQLADGLSGLNSVCFILAAAEACVSPLAVHPFHLISFIVHSRSLSCSHSFSYWRAYQDLLGNLELQVTLAGRCSEKHKKSFFMNPFYSKTSLISSALLFSTLVTLSFDFNLNDLNADILSGFHPSDNSNFFVYKCVLSVVRITFSDNEDACSSKMCLVDQNLVFLLGFSWATR